MNNHIFKLHSYFNELIGEEPEYQLKDIKNAKKFMSLRQLSIEFNVNRRWLSNWLKIYLIEKFGKDLAIKIYNNLWTSSNIHTKHKKDKLINVVKDQMKQYPQKVEEIDSIHTFSSDLGISRRSVTNWIKTFLFDKFGSIAGQIIYNNIWNRKHQKNNVSYKTIQSHIKRRGEILITKKNDFSEMNESPTKRYIDVKCEKGHLWNVRVNSILYLDVKCPMCNELRSEEIMRFFMEKLFGVKFPKTTLHSAYQISGQNGGRLQFDGYNGKVIINGNEFRIAFEYDGIQHNIYPNSYHRNKKEFEKQRHNDKKKIKIAKKYNTIIIRLKENNGFTYKNKEDFPQEINRLFQIETGLRIL